MKHEGKADLSWLENPEIFQAGRLKAHSDHQWFVPADEEGHGARKLAQSLNGRWKFHWSSCPGERPENFYQEDYDDSGFGHIQVPGHMELQGYGSIHYVNTMYPWDGKAGMRPPQIDWKDNPVGSYVKEFDLEPSLWGKRVCISFQGVEQAFFVWLNGVFVGYSEDSFTPADFDLTGLVRESANRLCVEVYKRSSAAWIEDQDFFRFSGIFRDVYLYGKPALHVEDLWAKAGLMDDYATGTFRLNVEISFDTGAVGGSLSWELKNREGRAVLKGGPIFLKGGSENQTIRTEAFEIPDIFPWSSENPYLYKLELTLRNPEGHAVETVPYSIGFRRFEIKDKIMLLNGERLIINGVNRHEWNPRKGRAITKEDMLQDLEILKKNHINAVRTCHYPNQSLWYQLCDENGIYVMDETNLESHGSWQKMGICEPSWNVPGNLPQWQECVLDRAKSMVERDKNHTSILWWSCGNESYAGTCILAISQYFHQTDPSRIVHYEGVFWNRKYDEISDVESRMYAPPESVREYLEHNPQKPFMLCEYMHDMGNSLGGMESYRKLMEEFPMFQGGFIWDFIDQAVYRKVNGTEALGYGGDFGDRPTDYAFSGNGILFADRREKPAMEEVRYWYLSDEERRKFDEKKRLAQAQADEAAYRKALLRKKKIEEDVQAALQFQVIRGDVNFGVRGKGFHMLFSYAEHGPVSLVYGGREWLYRAPSPAFWRASTDNDKGCGFPQKSALWCGADRFIACTGWHTEEKENLAAITYRFETCTNPKAQVQVTYEVNIWGDLKVKVCYTGAPGLPSLPVFGLRFLLPFAAEKIRWQGLKGETYPDRKKGSPFGTWESAMEKPQYLIPQEYGAHMDTRLAQLVIGKDQLEIGMEKEKPFGFSAIPYIPQELESALHPEELPPVTRTVLTVYGAMRGVGGIDSWGSDVEEAYHVPADGKIDFEFVIRGR